MTEKILKALLQLFAIIAKAEHPTGNPTGYAAVRRFLSRQFTAEVVETHMRTFESYVQAFHSSGGDARHARKRTSVNSVKVLGICTKVNEELEQDQKFVVLVHLLELVHGRGELGEQEWEFVSIVAEAFNIERESFMRSNAFVRAGVDEQEDSPDLLYIDAGSRAWGEMASHLHAHGLHGQVRVLHVPSVSLYLMRYLGDGELRLSGKPVHPGPVYVLRNGASLRAPEGQPIYYSEILSCFFDPGEEARIVFRADGITYTFPNGNPGLAEMHLAETSGKLIGIMGGSGSGKSTLLNVLNGNLKPDKGTVTINGVDVHAEADRIRGVIGHVSQEDLLIEELTVFQNLYYNAKLCFADLDEAMIREKVTGMLQSMGLFEVKDLKVGSVLAKTISGGQRKRLNIALELIREPSVLFVDEPTSGLSSRDSERIMDLLKQLVLKGRIVFTVIHQPSSELFKLFDRLLLMDQGGNPVYYGDPVDAVVYFRKVSGMADSDMGQCELCGNVNPEQIFDILEAKIVDEYGNETDQRRVGPDAWNEVFRAQMEVRVAKVPTEAKLPKSTFKAPGRLQQLSVFFNRDVRAKLANRQYVLINLLEAPVLALFMAFFLRFTGVGAGEGGYVYRHNDNIPQYLFISVIIALFLGLSVAAEEIIRDRVILQREKFLALSRSSYLVSKIGLLFTISAFQSLLFVLVGDRILGFQGMLFEHWVVLFSTACFANVLGLNVSASFNSAKVIYMMIPVLIIPQLMFSGIIVRFDKLHPWFANEKSVPWVGNIMASRWAYEAMAVAQFTDNAYEREFYGWDRQMKTANWRKDLWLRELRERGHRVRQALARPGGSLNDDLAADLGLLQSELAKEAEHLQGLEVPYIHLLTPEQVSEEVLDQLDATLDVLTRHYRRVYRTAEREKEQRISALTATPQLKQAYFRLLDRHRNESLADFVTNRNDINLITEYQGELVRKSGPIYHEPEGGLLEAHFYAPSKRVWGRQVPTLWANMMILWIMTIGAAWALKWNLLPALVDRLGGAGRG